MNDFVELRKVIAVLIKQSRLIIALAVIAAIAGYAYSQSQVPVFRATSTIIVGQSIQSTDISRGDFDVSRTLAQTYADMARRQPVLNAVAQALDLPEDWKDLKKRVRVQLVLDTQLLEISAEASSPAEAQLIADQVAHQLILLSPTNPQNREQSENQRLIRQRIEELQTRIEAGRERIKVLEAAMEAPLSTSEIQELQNEMNTLESLITQWEDNHTQLLIFVESGKSPNYLAIVEPAQVNSAPVRPLTLLNTIIAGMVGFMVAIGLIFLFEFLDDTWKRPDDIEQLLGVPALGSVSRMNVDQRQSKLITAQALFSPMTEGYRIIRSSIRFKSVDQPIKTIVVTSPNSGEGKSTTAANLGVVMAQTGLKTIIVDADLRHPTLHQIFQVPNLAGLTGWLCSPGSEIEEHLRKTSIENLRILTSGELPPNPAELLESARMEELLTGLKELADVVICDSPPVLPVTDAAVLSHQVDGALLVIQAGETRRDAAQKAVSILQQANANLLGAVLNQVSEKGGDYYYQGYYSPIDPITTPRPSRSGLRYQLEQRLPFLRSWTDGLYMIFAKWKRSEE